MAVVGSRDCSHEACVKIINQQVHAFSLGCLSTLQATEQEPTSRIYYSALKGLISGISKENLVPLSCKLIAIVNLATTTAACLSIKPSQNRLTLISEYLCAVDEFPEFQEEQLSQGVADLKSTLAGIKKKWSRGAFKSFRDELFVVVCQAVSKMWPQIQYYKSIEIEPTLTDHSKESSDLPPLIPNNTNRQTLTSTKIRTTNLTVDLTPLPNSSKFNVPKDKSPAVPVRSPRNHPATRKEEPIEIDTDSSTCGRNSMTPSRKKARHLGKNPKEKKTETRKGKPINAGNNSPTYSKNSMAPSREKARCLERDSKEKKIETRKDEHAGNESPACSRASSRESTKKKSRKRKTMMIESFESDSEVGDVLERIDRDPPSSPLPLRDLDEWSSDESDLIKTKPRSTPPKKKRKAPVPWLSYEEENLCKGIKKFGVGKWRSILRHFKFEDCRDNISLKDKYRNMKKNNQI